MSNKGKETFGESVLHERDQNNLIHPSSRIPQGYAGVHVGEYAIFKDLISHEYAGDSKMETFRVSIPPRRRTDVIVGDENRNPIDRQTIHRWRCLTDKRYSAAILRAVESGFDKAASYAEAAGVPVDLERTYIDTTFR